MRRGWARDAVARRRLLASRLITIRSRQGRALGGISDCGRTVLAENNLVPNKPHLRSIRYDRQRDVPTK